MFTNMMFRINKILILIFSLAAFVASEGNAQNVVFKWADQVGGTNNGRGQSVALDASGNVIATGMFSGTMDFDAGPGTMNLSSFGDFDIFVSKSDASGNLIWVKQMGGIAADMGYSVALDGTGNIYVTGIFTVTADFDPGAGTYNLISAGDKDIFVMKLDAMGNLIWAKRMGGTNYDYGWSIAVDASGNAYTTGWFTSIVDFDPGTGTVNFTAGAIDIFISKLDANGNFVWARQIGAGASDNGHSIKVDAAGNVYSTGYFIGTVDFDPGAGVYNVVSAGGWDAYVLKLDALGNFVWAKHWGSAYTDDGSGLALDGSGNVLVTGTFDSPCDFDPGAGVFTLTPAGNYDIFVCKLTSAGNFVWAKQLGGAGQDEGYGISTDAAGDVYTTGSYNLTGDFNPGAGTYNLTSNGSFDVFISKLDANGNFVWAKGMGGTSYEQGFSCTVDATGNIYSTGYFNTTVDFDPDAGTYNLNAHSTFSDIFLQKLGPPSPLPVSLVSFSGLRSPNGNQLEWDTQSEVNNDYFILERSTDGIDFDAIGLIQGAGNSNTIRHYDYLDENISGTKILYYRLVQTDFDGTTSCSKTIALSRSLHLEEAISVFPNPVTDKLNVIFDFETDRELQLSIYDLQGHVMTQLTRKFNKEEHILTLPLSEILQSKPAPGNYLLQISDGNFSAVREIHVRD